SLRDNIPDLFAIVASNLLLSLAFARQIEALRIFTGRRPDARIVYAPVVATTLLEIAFTYPLPSMRWRTATVSAVFCVQMLSAVHALLDAPAPRRRSQLLTAAAFLTLAFA